MAGSVLPRPFGLGSVGVQGIPASVYIASAAVHPAWRLLAPEGATDPWWVWWAVSAGFFVGLGILRGTSARWLSESRLCAGFSWTVTAHLLALSTWNDMHAFYALGTILCVFTTALAQNGERRLRAYMIWLGALCSLFGALHPQALMVAYWAPLWVSLGYFDLRAARLEAQARLARREQRGLEHAVAIRTETLQRRTRDLEASNQALRASLEERAQLEARLAESRRLEYAGRTARGLAHDCNNLLTAIVGCSQELLDGLDPGHPGNESAREIRIAAERAAALTGRLLNLDPQEQDAPEPLDLDVALGSIEGVLRGLVGRRIRLELDLRAGCRVRISRPQLEQLVLNLAGNARDAMPDGGRLWIETGRWSAGGWDPCHGDQVLLRFRDSGEGMDEETLERVFEPYFTTKPVGKGTGLGMAIVQDIVESAGGRIRIRSTRGGGGTEIAVFLPCASEPA